MSMDHILNNDNYYIDSDSYYDSEDDNNLKEYDYDSEIDFDEETDKQKKEVINYYKKLGVIKNKLRDNVLLVLYEKNAYTDELHDEFTNYKNQYISLCDELQKKEHVTKNDTILLFNIPCIQMEISIIDALISKIESYISKFEEEYLQDQIDSIPKDYNKITV